MRTLDPGPQPHNQIADTFEEQLWRAMNWATWMTGIREQEDLAKLDCLAEPIGRLVGEAVMTQERSRMASRATRNSLGDLGPT